MKPSAPTPSPYVDLEAAARMAGVTRRTVQNKLSSREIPRKAVRMNGRQKLVSVAALEAVFGPLKPSPSGDEVHGSVHGNFHEAPSEVAELRAKLAAQNTIITSLQSTLDHERQDRAHERENWRKTLERTQANLLAAQDTPTEPAKPKPKRAKKPAARPWWALLK